jgi:hypothetical protein
MPEDGRMDELKPQRLRMARPDDYNAIAAVAGDGWGRTGPVPGYNGPGRDFMVFSRRL